MQTSGDSRPGSHGFSTWAAVYAAERAGSTEIVDRRRAPLRRAHAPLAVLFHELEIEAIQIRAQADQRLGRLDRRSGHRHVDLDAALLRRGNRDAAHAREKVHRLVSKQM